MFTDGDIAQKVMAETIAFHPSKDSRRWYIRDSEETEDGFNHIDVLFVPKLSVLEDKEAALHGQAVQHGDLKLTVAGDLEIDTDSVLVTKNAADEVEQWLVFFAYLQTYQGVVQERRLYVRPLNQEIEE